MTTDEAVVLVSQALGKSGIPYIVVGGFSSNTHGVPRSTKDLDVVVSITALRFPDLLPILGPGWRCDPQYSFETNTGTVRMMAEDVIVWKLRWARPKDLDDVRSVIFVREREGKLDWNYIRSWCAKHGTTDRLENAIASLPQRKT